MITDGGTDSMQTRDVYRGTDGDTILYIIRFGVIRPNFEQKLYFSQWHFDSVLMHGTDMKRKITLAVKLRVTIPSTAVVEQKPTDGVADTLIVETSMPLQAEVLELYVREPGAGTVKTIKGARDITQYLEG